MRAGTGNRETGINQVYMSEHKTGETKKKKEDTDLAMTSCDFRLGQQMAV